MKKLKDKTNTNKNIQHKEMLGYEVPEGYFEKNRTALYNLAKANSNKGNSLEVVHAKSKNWMWFAAASIVLLLVFVPMFNNSNSTPAVLAIQEEESVEFDEMLLVYFTGKKNRALAFDDMQLNQLMEEVEMQTLLDPFVEGENDLDEEINVFYLETL